MFFDEPMKMGSMRTMLKFILLLVIALLAGCALTPKQAANGQPGLSDSEAQTRYQQGLARYRDNRFATAFSDLDAAVSSGHLQLAEAIDARKHMAFIHCTSKREAQCREQFQTILKLDSNFDLPPNESSHPGWGPVWRSIKGSIEDQRAVARGSRLMASTAQQKLAEGIKEYDAGRYRESIDALQLSIKSGLTDKADEIRAHKYSAFASCLVRKSMQCRSEFRTIFALDPAFQLVPSEAGHPAWAAIYRKEMTAAKRSNATLRSVKK
jgi:hypothetical protein